MIGLALPDDRPLKLLCLGAHGDDIEIGAGGTILQLLRRPAGCEILWVVFSGGAERRAEVTASATAFTAGAHAAEIRALRFRDGYLPYEGATVKETMEGLRASFEPDLVLTHTQNDRHQDHRTVAELSWTVYRDQLILEYEIPKWEGDLRTPQLYVPLDAEIVDRKIDLLMRHFTSQRRRDWFTQDAFRAIMRLRGLECRAASGFAEGFQLRKAILPL